jgi:hypothetical protein
LYPCKKAKPLDFRKKIMTILFFLDSGSKNRASIGKNNVFARE